MKVVPAGKWSCPFCPNDYQKSRLEKIARNKQKLLELLVEVPSASTLVNDQTTASPTEEPIVEPRTEPTTVPLSSEGGVPSAPLRMTRGGNTIGKNGYFWTKEEECRLFDWYEASCFVNIEISNIDYSKIAKDVGRSEKACCRKLLIIVKSEVLTQQVMREMMDVFQNYEYSQDVPSNMRLAKLASVDTSKKSFLEQQARGASAFHLTQVHPTQMSQFNKALFIQLNPNLQIDEIDHNLLDSLDGKQCIMADNYIRQPGVHDFDKIPNPHLKHPTTGDFRIDIHNKTYLCNFLFFALNKYRTAGDREKWYNYQRSEWSYSCYLYIVRNEETIRSGFGDVGVGIGETIGLECFGKSKYPVQYDGCYKVKWNGRGIRNATFIYLPL